MSRKPADKLRPDQTRQAIWEIIRRLKTFTIADILYDVRLSRSSVLEYITGLLKAGHLERQIGIITGAASQASKTSYTLIKNTGMEAPRVRKDGTPVIQGLPREQLWGAMGMFAQKGVPFTVRDLTELSPLAAESDAKHYCHCLYHAGYLMVVTPGKSGTLTKYKMPAKKWTGPHSVQIQRVRRTFDPNTGAVADIAVISVEGGE